MSDTEFYASPADERLAAIYDRDEDMLREEQAIDDEVDDR